MNDTIPETTPFTVSGTIHNDPFIAIPSTAKVYAVWAVPSANTLDNLYVYGVGDVDPSTGTFSLTLTDPPPAEALNNNEVGVAYLMLVDGSMPTGEISDSALAVRLLTDGAFYGSINDRALVYVSGNPQITNDGRFWVSGFDFKRGYNLAKGWYNTDTTGFDGFMPDSGPVELQITQDPTVFVYPNWY